ncbi:ABC transporter substrate-binding protein [Butyrivibrio proteoclasticus]|uniref:ABC transporter substrate-binding protein n=1 Tax=Butyrivibrio proteoclasticus TaxID=43305 RepID=UPI000684B3D5|nr:ABC transporter substrate-binding protein [Butyrivibrio proteoclasticus]
MKLKTKVQAVALSVFMAAQILTGCGSANQTTQASADATANQEVLTGERDDAASETSANVTVTESGTRIVTDVFGREVEIPAEVNTCAALGSAARLITYAGGVEKIIGCTEMELKGAPGMPFAYANKDHFAACTAVASGGSGNADYAEALIELAPDVVFYQDSDTVAIEDLAQKTGLPIIGVYGDAFNSHYLTDSISLIGEVLGCKDHSDVVVDAINGWVKDLNDRTKDIPEDQKPTVYPGAVSWSGGHGFTGTYAGYAPLEAINAINLSDTLDAEDGFEVSMEQILDWDPDIIFLNPSNMELVNEDYASNGSAIDSLTAVKEGKVYSQVNFNYYWCNMELAIVDSYYAGSIIYPEAFADVNFEEKAEEIFNVMIGMDYLDVLNENNMGFGQMTIGE